MRLKCYVSLFCFTNKIINIVIGWHVFEFIPYLCKVNKRTTVWTHVFC